MGAAEATYQEELAQTNQVSLFFLKVKLHAFTCRSFTCAVLVVRVQMCIQMFYGCGLECIQMCITQMRAGLECSSSSLCVLDASWLTTCPSVNCMLRLSLEHSGTAQHSTAQYSTAHHSTAHRSCVPGKSQSLQVFGQASVWHSKTLSIMRSSMNCRLLFCAVQVSEELRQCSHEHDVMLVERQQHEDRLKKV